MKGQNMSSHCPLEKRMGWIMGNYAIIEEINWKE